MPVSSRRERIEAMLKQEPDDQFLRYSLALELEKDGEHDQSLRMLEELARGEPPYVPAYFMAGQQLTKLGKIPKAQEILRDGIEVARQQGDAHAAGEMSEFLATLGGTIV